MPWTVEEDDYDSEVLFVAASPESARQHLVEMYPAPCKVNIGPVVMDGEENFLIRADFYENVLHRHCCYKTLYRGTYREVV